MWGSGKMKDAKWTLKPLMKTQWRVNGKKSLRVICFLLQSGGQDAGDFLERLSQVPLCRRLLTQLCLSHQAIEGRRSLHHLRGQTQIGEGACDLLHLPHPAVGFGRHARDLAREPLKQFSLAVLQLVARKWGGSSLDLFRAAQAEKFERCMVYFSCQERRSMRWSPRRKLPTLAGVESTLFHSIKVKRCPQFCSIS